MKTPFIMDIIKMTKLCWRLITAPARIVYRYLFRVELLVVNSVEFTTAMAAARARKAGE